MTPQPAKCRGCGKEILWIENPNGKREPFDARKTRVLLQAGPTGTPGSSDPLASHEIAYAHVTHWGTCPKAGDFKRGS